MKRSTVEKGVMILLFIFAVIVPVSFIIMIIWNSILIEVLQKGAINKINFWQALGLLALAKILFGGLSSNWWPAKSPQKKANKEPVLEKLQNMTEEEKEQFRQQWHLQFESSLKEKSNSCGK